MGNSVTEYSIDDRESAEVNIQALADQLKAADAKLANVLAPYLQPLSHGATPDSAAILDALFDAAQEPSKSDAEDGAA